MSFGRCRCLRCQGSKNYMNQKKMNLRAQNFYENKTETPYGLRAQTIFLRTGKYLRTQGPPNSTNRRRITWHVLIMHPQRLPRNPAPVFFFFAYLLFRVTSWPPETSPTPMEPWKKTSNKIYPKRSKPFPQLFFPR